MRNYEQAASKHHAKAAESHAKAAAAAERLGDHEKAAQHHTSAAYAYQSAKPQQAPLALSAPVANLSRRFKADGAKIAKAKAKMKGTSAC